MPNIKKIIYCLVALFALATPFSLQAQGQNVLKPVSFENLFIDDFFWYFHFRAQRINTLPHIWQRIVTEDKHTHKLLDKDLDEDQLCRLLETMSYIYKVEPDCIQKSRIEFLASRVSLDKINSQKGMAAFYQAALAYTRVGGELPLLHQALQHAEQYSMNLLQKSNIKGLSVDPLFVLALGDFYTLTNNKLFLNAAYRLLQQMKSMGRGVDQGYYYAAQVWIDGLMGHEAKVKQNHHHWLHLVDKTMRITGGYSLQDDRAPQHRFSLFETMANMEWSMRLYQITHDVRCMDQYERALYNELRTGISFHGGFVPHRMYVDEQKPLQRDSINEVPLKQLIPLVRSLAVLPDNYYATCQDTAIYINQYFRGEVKIQTKGVNLKLSSMSSMPWNGGYYMDIITDKTQKCTFYLRVPSWLTQDVMGGISPYLYQQKNNRLLLSVNDKEIPIHIEQGFMKVTGEWKNGDRIIFRFPSPIWKTTMRQVNDKQQLAIQRGPFVFCLEESDTEKVQNNLAVRLDESLSVKFSVSLMGGVQILELNQYDLQADSVQSIPNSLIPYFARGQRGRAQVKIWFPYFTETLK